MEAVTTVQVANEGHMGRERKGDWREDRVKSYCLVERVASVGECMCAWWGGKEIEEGPLSRRHYAFLGC